MTPLCTPIASLPAALPQRRVAQYRCAKMHGIRSAHFGSPEVLTRSIFCALVVLVGSASAASAQACERWGGTFYDFQVDRKAAYAGDTTLIPRPVDVAPSGSANAFRILFVQMVVDTGGRPVSSSLKVIVGGDSTSAKQVGEVLDRWQFTPAMAHGCKVQQLVQTRVIALPRQYH